MRSKRIMALVLIGTVSFGGVKAFAQMSENTVTKNTVMTEKVVIQASKKENNEDILKEVVLNAFEKYFNEKIDVKNLKENIQVIKADVEWNLRRKDYSEISWRNSSKSYYALVENDGQIIDMGIIFNTQKGSQKVTLIELEEAKKIAVDFIKQKKLVEDVETLGFLGEATISPETCGIVYKYGKGKGILVSVDSSTKKVKQFSYMTESVAQKCVENTGYRENGILG